MSNVLQGSYKYNENNENNKSHLEFSNKFTSLIALIILLGSGYLDEIVGCSSIKILTKNMYVKHILLLAVIYVSIDVNKDNKISPLYNLKDTLMLYGYYLILTKLDKNFTIGIFILLGLLYGLNRFNIYYQLNNINDKESKSRYILKILEKLIIFITIIGFVMYLIKQFNEQKNFNPSKFILGVLDCKNK